MTNKKVIFISAATCLAINTITWLIGWLAWPVVFLGLWFVAGYLGHKIDKKFNNNNYESLVFFLIFGPMWLACSINDNWQRLREGLPKLPKFRNPFFWPEK